MASLVNGLGGSAGFGEGVLRRNDDSYERIDISSVFSQGMNFFGTNYTSFYVNNNGNITFNNGMSTFTPYAITGSTSNPIIAPYFADVDTRSTNFNTSTGGTSTGTNNVYYDFDTQNGIITITWDDVGYYSYRTDLVNAFQLQIVRRNTSDFDIVFRYEDVQWTTGNASGGTNGLGGTVARAGWSAGDGTNYFELSSSGNQAEMLRLDDTVGNSRLAGYWTFSVRNGQTVNPYLNPMANRNDFNGDGYADMLWFNSTTRQIAVWSMHGFDRIGAAAIQNTVNAEWTVASTGDYDGNGRSDILFRNTTSGALAVWSMDGLSRATSAVSTSSGLSSTTRVVGSGDINGDGRADVFLHDTSAGTVSVALMGANLSLGTPTVLQQSVQTVWTVGGMGDFNGDRNGDILWRNSETGQVAIWLMNGTTRIGANVVQSSVDLNWTLESTGDFNGDGNTDILWRHSDGRVATWMMNGLDRIGASVLSTGPLSSAWTISDTTDYNSDGTSDILLRNASTGGVAIWTMNGTTVTDQRFVQQNVLGEWSVMNDRAYV